MVSPSRYNVRCLAHEVEERRTKDHIRSIHKMSVSHVVQHYCITGSADGDMRVWVRLAYDCYIYESDSVAGPSRYVKVPHACPSPYLCSQCRLLSKPLAASSGSSWAG